MGPRLHLVNRLRWEVGHVAWFHESSILQRVYRDAPLIDNGHALYDSIAVHHHKRRGLPLPPRPENRRDFR